MVYFRLWQKAESEFVKTGHIIYQNVYPLSGIIGPIVLLLADNLSVIFDPHYDAIRNSISDLALGSMGWLSRSGFGIFAVLLSFEIIRMKHFVPNDNKTRAAVVLSLCSSLGFLLLAIFTTDPPGVNTLHGTIHDIVTLIVAVFFTIGCLLFGLGFKNNRKWKGFYIYTMVVVGISFACAILRIIMPAHWAFFGLYERILLWDGLIWFEAVGIKIFISTKHEHPA
jgi:hypothetical membrane protein